MDSRVDQQVIDSQIKIIDKGGAGSSAPPYPAKKQKEKQTQASRQTQQAKVKEDDNGKDSVKAKDEIKAKDKAKDNTKNEPKGKEEVKDKDRGKGKELKKGQVFHRPGCPIGSLRPGDDPDTDYFVRRGMTQAGAVRWQCKKCGKTTNVSATIPNPLSYKQRINGIMKPLFMMIAREKTVTEICQALDISPKTYYHKLGLLSGHLAQVKREAEEAYYRKVKTAELSLSTVVRLYGKKQQVAGLVASFDQETGYLYEAYYQEASSSLKDFMGQVLPAHFKDLLARTQASSLRVCHTDFWDQAILEAMEEAGLSFSWQAATNQEGQLLERLQARMGHLGERYVKDYLHIYSYVHNFLPELFEAGQAPRAPFSLAPLKQILAEA